MRIKVCLYSIALLLIASSINVNAQSTIPDQLARHGVSLGSGPSIPSGPAPSLDRILAETDAIVKGIVGDPQSYLSEDQTRIYTDYPLRNPEFLYQSAIDGSPKPQMPVATVTLLGGKITINGLSFTSKHEALPSLDPGTEGVFLLKYVGGRYYVAGLYYGAFRLTETGLIPLTSKGTFAPELQGLPASQAAEALVNRTVAIRAGTR